VAVLGEPELRVLRRVLGRRHQRRLALHRVADEAIQLFPLSVGLRLGLELGGGLGLGVVLGLWVLDLGLITMIHRSRKGIGGESNKCKTT
jgi:hypothetical protein